MAAGLEYKFTGLEDLTGRLQGLPTALRKKGFRFAGRKAAMIIHAQAVANAQALDDPVTAQQIAKNIVVRFSNRTFTRTGDILFRVGVLGGARNYEAYGEVQTNKPASQNPGGDTWYWRLLEFGTETVPAKHFMRDALSSTSEKATSEFASQLDKWLDRNLKRITKKGL